MQSGKEHIILKMNEFGRKRKPFVFLIDFDFQKPLLLDWEESREKILWQTPNYQNFEQKTSGHRELKWKVVPVSYNRYKKAFDLVQKHIHKGDSYLLNLTMPSKVSTNYSLEGIFHASDALYKVFLKNDFVCFSPETFVRIQDRQISSYPMKGTIDAGVEKAEFVLKNDCKELAEHNTIVDLIRNDLSTVADQVLVERFRYIDRIKSNQSDLLQMSSQIIGQLPENYYGKLGSIIMNLLPAGSVTGSPKKKTVEIIKHAEQYKRAYYTGIFGIFDGKDLDSCVLIRYLEQQKDQFIFKSGGGITFLSQCEKEYHELIKKIYVPFA